MAKTALNDLTIQRLPIPEAGQVTHWDTNPRGFGVRLSQGGSRTFVVKKDGKLVSLGRYPSVSLKVARGEAKRLLADPTPIYAPKPLAEAVQSFLDYKKRTTKRDTHQAYEYYLNTLAFKGLVRYLNKRMIFDAIEKHFAGKTTAQNACFSVVRNFTNWLFAEDLIERPILYKAKAPNKLKSRERVLTDEELKTIWQHTNFAPYGHIIRLLILTGARKEEIRKLVVDHPETITFPDTKNGKAHTLPITPLIRQHLPQPSFKWNNWTNEKDRLDAKVKIAHYRIHDIRRSVATGMQRLGVRSEVIERLLNHITTGVRGVYQRYDYMPEIREALLLWENHIKTITTT